MNEELSKEQIQAAQEKIKERFNREQREAPLVREAWTKLKRGGFSDQSILDGLRHSGASDEEAERALRLAKDGSAAQKRDGFFDKLKRSPRN